MISASFSFHAYACIHISSTVWDTALSYNVHSQCSSTCDSICRPSSKNALFFYQHSVNLIIMFDNTITSQQAVTIEINLKEFNATVSLPYRCQPTPPTSSTMKDNLFHVQESWVMKNLIATTYNLSSILREVKDRTVELKISEVCLYLCTSTYYEYCTGRIFHSCIQKSHVHTHTNTLT